MGMHISPSADGLGARVGCAVVSKSCHAIVARGHEYCHSHRGEFHRLGVESIQGGCRHSLVRNRREVSRHGATRHDKEWRDTARNGKATKGDARRGKASIKRGGKEELRCFGYLATVAGVKKKEDDERGEVR